MTTPQDIREKGFDKARAMFGGYDMGAVDDYLEVLANDFETLQKENAALKGKMKVLVDKIEEYRSDESALNKAILSAQKLSVQIENDARARSAAIVSEAEAKAASILGGIDERIAQEEARLQAAKISTAKLIDSVRALCQNQLNNIETIGIASGAAAPSAAQTAAPAAEEIRIPEAEIIEQAPVSEPNPLDAGNTQVFMFSQED